MWQRGAGQGYCSLISEAQRPGSLALSVVGLVDALKERRADGTALAGSLDHKQSLVDGPRFGDRLGEMVQASWHVEVGRLVDDRLDAQRAAVLLGAGGEDPRPVGGGSVCAAGGRTRRDLLGAADADVVLHQRLEARARAARVVEHLRARDLELAHRQLPPVPGETIPCSQRRGDGDDPAVKERLPVLGAEAVADRLQPLGIGAAREPVVQPLIPQPDARRLALDPLVPLTHTFAGHGA
jgi:hypothetical protein